MRAIFETSFDAIYLIGVIILGIIMIIKSKNNKLFKLFCTTGLENYTYALGIGKFITSITMTIFYVILYYIWRIR